MNKFHINKESHLFVAEFESDDYGNSGFIFHDFEWKSFDLLLLLFKQSKHCLTGHVDLPPLSERLKPLLNKGIDLLGLPLRNPEKAAQIASKFDKPVKLPQYKFDLPKFYKYLDHLYPQVRKAYMTREEYDAVMPKPKPKKFIPKPPKKSVNS